MGTPEFALPSLRTLLENGYSVAAVVTAPDKPAGRGRRVQMSAVKKFSVERGLDVLQPPVLGDSGFISGLRDLGADLFVIVAFRILPPAVFTLAGMGSINLHASLLPRFRGPAPINWAIMRGERETGVTTFFLQEKVDTGRIILQARLPIGPDETAGELHDRLAAIGAEVVLHTVRLIEQGTAQSVPQDDALASPAPKIFTGDCRIDWAKSAAEVHNFVRGLSPRPGAFTTWSGGVVKILRTRLAGPVSPNGGRAGEILEAHGRLIVGTAEGSVEILEIQQEGKKRLTAGEFLSGSRLRTGERFQ